MSNKFVVLIAYFTSSVTQNKYECSRALKLNVSCHIKIFEGQVAVLQYTYYIHSRDCCTSNSWRNFGTYFHSLTILTSSLEIRMNNYGIAVSY